MTNSSQTIFGGSQVENLSVVSESNVVSIEERRENLSFLTMLGKSDPDVKDFVRLIHQYDLREKAVSLLKKKIARKKPSRPVFLK